MSYGIVLSTRAEEALGKMPVEVRRFALLQLRNLGETPTALSVRSHFPYREQCQLFQFEYDLGLQRWRVNVLFQYAQDEQNLDILGIAAIPQEPWEGVGAGEPE